MDKTREEILAMEDVEKRLKALDRYYYVRQAEMDRQMLDVTKSFTESSSSQRIARAIDLVSEYDGTNIPLREFIQDV